jgi:hypothetical protein
VDISMH